MADDKGNLIHELPSPTTPHRRDAGKGDDGAPRPCTACGHRHGSIGVHIGCLDREIVKLRAALARAPGGR